MAPAQDAAADTYTSKTMPGSVFEKSAQQESQKTNDSNNNKPQDEFSVGILLLATGQLLISERVDRPRTWLTRLRSLEKAQGKQHQTLWTYDIASSIVSLRTPCCC